MPRLGATSHTMIGAGGRIVEPKSESAVLSEAIQLLHGMSLRDGDPRDAQLFDRALRLLKGLKGQVSEGYHRNPAGLVVFSNPPVGLRRRTLKGPGVVGLIGTEVDAIYYRNADGQRYKHDFEDAKRILMFAVERGGQRDITITHEDGKPLWLET